MLTAVVTSTTTQQQRKPIFIAPKRYLEQSVMEVCDDESIVIVEPTDPDEDRKMEQEGAEPDSDVVIIEGERVLKQEEVTPVVRQKNPTGITTDPVLLNQILHALSAKPVKSVSPFPTPISITEPPVFTSSAAIGNSQRSTQQFQQQQPRLLVASSNVYTIQAQAPTQARSSISTSIMLQPINGIQSARIVTSPLAMPQISSGTVSMDPLKMSDVLPNFTAVTTAAGQQPSTNIQQLLSANPMMSGVLVNCATANLITQLANSISSSMLNFAQSMATDKAANLPNQIGELTQMLSVLTTLASTLSTSLPGMVTNIRTGTPVPTNPILTGLINQVTSTNSPPQSISSMIPLNTFKLLSDVSRMSNNTTATVSCTSVQPTVMAVSIPASSVLPVPNITISPSQSGYIPVLSEMSNASAVGSLKSPTHFNAGVRIRRFSCHHSGCGRAFSSRFNLIEHIRTHTGERPFICSVTGCKSKFKRRRDLAEHDVVHKSLKPDGGPLLALLTEKATKKEEMEDDDEEEEEEEEDEDEEEESANGISEENSSFETTNNPAPGSRKRRRHFCPFPNCTRSYARRHRLNQHMCQHTGIGPYYCDQPSCSVKYFCESDLERHKLIHLVPSSGDPLKRHLCPYPGCGKAYSKLNKLREHVRSHTGERPYVCEHPGCFASFIRLYGLKRHQLTHVPPPPPRNEERGRYATILPDLNAMKPINTTLIPSINPSLVASQVRVLPKPITTHYTPICPLPPIPPMTIIMKPEPLSDIMLTPKDPETEEENEDLDKAATKEEEGTVVKTRESPILLLNEVPSVEDAAAIVASSPLMARSTKASATPSASAIALKAVVIPGPFGKRRHICPMLGCKKIFPKLNKLREHICRHTGERPYACHECPATFVRMYDLRRHALIHERKKNSILA